MKKILTLTLIVFCFFSYFQLPGEDETRNPKPYGSIDWGKIHHGYSGRNTGSSEC